MQYYIKISKIGKDENVCTETDCCRLTFWNKVILITEEFYRDLLREKNVMLIPEMDNNGNYIPNMELYFEKTVEFTVVDNEVTLNRKVLICELNAYFISSDSDDPF